MYKRNKCPVCGYVMVGELSANETIYYCPKPGHTDIPVETACFRNSSLADYDVPDYTYQDIARSLLI